MSEQEYAPTLATLAEAKDEIARLRSVVHSQSDDLRLANTRLANLLKTQEQLKTAMQNLVGEMYDNDSDFLTSEYLKEAAELLDLSMTEDVSFTVMVRASVTISVPFGESGKVTDLNLDRFEMSHDSYELTVDTYEVDEIEKD